MQESASSEGWFTSAFSWLVSSTPKDTSQSLATGTGRNTVRLHPLTPTGSLQALLYEDDPVVWQTRVRTSDATPGRSTVSDPYRNFLKGAAQLVRAHALQGESVPLLVTLGPPWQDKEMYRHWQASTWEERDVRWECPTGLGMIPLDQLFAICCRLHEHLGMVEGPQSSGSGPESNRFAILHSHTCSNTSSQLSTFVAVCHLLYSCGFDSVNDALQTLQAIPPNLQARKLLQGQRRYCDYVNCIIHMDYLPPESDKSVVLKHVTFRKLNAFAAMKYGGLTMAPKGESERGTPSRRPVAHAMPSDGSEASTPREGSLPGSRSHTPTPWWQYDLEQADSDKLNPDRILLSVISRGVEVWAGGVAPGSVDEEEDLVCFDFTRRGGGEGLTLLGDFVLALWFDDHKSTYDRPAISYVDHTAFLGHSSGDAASEISRRITARQLDVSNPSYADYADKEGFYMEVTFRRGESPGEGAVLGPCMNLHVPTVRAERAEVISRFGMIRCELEDGEESEGRQPSARAVIRQLRSHQKLKTPPYRLQTATGDDQLPEDNSPLVSSSGNLSFGYGGGMHPIFLQTSEVELTPLGSNRSSEQGSTCTPRMASTTVLPQGDEPEVTSRLASNGIANSNEAQGADGDEVIASQVHAEHQLQSPGSIGKKKGLPPPPPPPLPPGGDTTEHQLQSPGSVGKKKGLPPPPLPPGGDTTDSQLKSPGSVVKKKGLPPPPPPPLPPGGDTTEHQLKSPGSVGKKKGLPPPPPPPLPPGGETTEHQLQSPGSVGKKKGLPPPPPPPLPPGSRSPVASLSESSPGGDTTESQLQSPGSVGRKKSLAPPPPPPLPPGGDTTESQLQSPGSVGKKKSLAPPPPPPPPLPPGNKPASPASAKTNEKKAPPAPPSPALSNHFTPGPKLRSYYWSKARTGQGTVWDEIAPVSELSDPYAEALISLFKVNATPMKENMSPGSGVKKKTVPTIVKVIPLPRANNISIMLTKFSEFGGRLGDNIRDAIMSGSERLSTEQLTLLAQIAPTPDESKALTAYPGPPSELSPPEQFLLTMTTVPRLQAKISTLMFLRQFESLCSDALAGLEALCAACNQIRSSKRFRRVLATILATGNMLNAGTHRGNAEAVKFESLLKMGDLKVTKISQKSDEKDLQESLSVKVPPIRSLVDFIAWTVLLQSVSQNEFSGKDALEIARNGFLAHELSSLTDAVKRMQLDVVEALTALDSGMSAVRREVDAEGPTRNSGDFCFETEPQSRFQRVLQSFIDTADKEQEMIKAFAEKSQKQVSMTIKWLGESADSDALTVFQMVRTFMNDFDQAFGRICRSIDKDGI